jgi:ATP-binding cassette subfamily B protein
MRPLFHKWWQGESTLSARLSETLSGIRVVKAFAQEGREIVEFEKHNRNLLRLGVETSRSQAIFVATMSLVIGLGVVVLWLFGGLGVIAGDLTVGTLVAFYSYVLMFYGPLQWFGHFNSWLTQAVTGAERIFEILDTPPEAYQDPDAVPLPHTEGRVTFRQVTFGYDPSKPVLHDLDLDVAPGETIGLVGKSGAGKTTMMNLLCRFYEVDRGSIEVDGMDIRQIRLEDLRNQLGVVLQEPFLFSGTIAENISYGRPGASFEELVQAAKVANAHTFILAKPDGYDTEVGEHGHKLSGGEKQRIALARAVLRDPKLLILDEATSSLDAQNEQLIQQAIDRLAKHRTTFIIAHRLSTVRNVDRLVVLDAGRVVEVGSYEELLARQGAFYNLVRLQQAVPATMRIDVRGSMNTEHLPQLELTPPAVPRPVTLTEIEQVIEHMSARYMADLRALSEELSQRVQAIDRERETLEVPPSELKHHRS